MATSSAIAAGSSSGPKWPRSDRMMRVPGGKASAGGRSEGAGANPVGTPGHDRQRDLDRRDDAPKTAGRSLTKHALIGRQVQRALVAATQAN